MSKVFAELEGARWKAAKTQTVLPADWKEKQEGDKIKEVVSLA